MALWQLLNLGTGCTVTHSGEGLHCEVNRVIHYTSYTHSSFQVMWNIWNVWKVLLSRHGLRGTWVYPYANTSSWRLGASFHHGSGRCPILFALDIHQMLIAFFYLFIISSSLHHLERITWSYWNFSFLLSSSLLLSLSSSSSHVLMWPQKLHTFTSGCLYFFIAAQIVQVAWSIEQHLLGNWGTR